MSEPKPVYDADADGCDLSDVQYWYASHWHEFSSPLDAIEAAWNEAKRREQAEIARLRAAQDAQKKHYIALVNRNATAAENIAKRADRELNERDTEIERLRAALRHIVQIANTCENSTAAVVMMSNIAAVNLPPAPEEATA